VLRFSHLFIFTRFLTVIKEGPMRLRFYRSLSGLLACILRGVSMHVAVDSQTPYQNIIRLALSTKDQQRWGPAPGNHGQVGLFHFHFNFRRAL
jgi:hypothetical protein